MGGNNRGGPFFPLARIRIAPSGARFARHGPGGASDARLCTAKPGDPGSPRRARVHRHGRGNGGRGSVSASSVRLGNRKRTPRKPTKRRRCRRLVVRGHRLIVEAWGGNGLAACGRAVSDRPGPCGCEAHAARSFQAPQPRHPSSGASSCLFAPTLRPRPSRHLFR